MKLNKTEDVFVKISEIVTDEQFFYSAFLQLLNVDPKYKNLRHSLVVPQTQRWNIIPRDIIPTYFRINIGCAVGRPQTDIPLLPSHVAAIEECRAISATEDVQLCKSPAPDLHRQISDPQVSRERGYPIKATITLESARPEGRKVAGSEVLFRCSVAASVHEFDKKIAEHLQDDTTQTVAVCRHWVSMDTMNDLLEAVTAPLDYTFDITRDSTDKDYSSVRLIRVDENRMTVVCDRHFSRFIKRKNL